MAALMTLKKFSSLPETSRGMILSLAAHLAILLFVLIQSLFTEAPIDLSQAIRVDMVGLPEKAQTLPSTPMAEPAKPTPAEPEVKPQEVAPVPKALPIKSDTETINIQKTKKKQQEALNKIKTMSAIDKIKQEVASEKKAAPVKGNIISPGTDLTGLDKLQHQNYAVALDRHVKQFWALPEWLARKGLTARVLVRLDETGAVLSKDIVKTSGEKRFDESALDTIDQASPMPAPPTKLSAKVRVDGILIEFGP